MAKPGPAPSVTPEDVLDVFAAREDATEPLTAPEIADRMEVSRGTVRKNLDRLAERGDVASKKIGARARVWWVPSRGEADGWREGFGAFGGSKSSFAEHARAERDTMNADLEERERELS